MLATVLVFSPAYAKRSLDIAPQPFPTVEDLLYDTYFDLQSSIRRLGDYRQGKAPGGVYQLWSYNHEFNITDRPKELLPRILKVYAQVFTKNGKPYFSIMLEEIKYRLNGIEEVHHVYMEDHNLDTFPDVIEENWLVIDTSKGRRTIKEMRSKGDPKRGEPRIDKRWNYWFAYWIKVQVLEFKDSFRERPFPDEPPRREV